MVELGGGLHPQCSVFLLRGLVPNKQGQPVSECLTGKAKDSGQRLVWFLMSA